MELYECGTNVKSVQGNMQGIITGINIRFGAIQYEFSYWLNGDHKSIWVSDVEIESEKEKQKIGFIK